MEQKIKLNIIGRNGQDTEELTVDEALTRIRELNKSGKWIYLDQQPEESIDKITPEALLAAEDITITNDLQGG